MLTTATLIALLKSQASLAILAATIIGFIATEEASQFEIVQAMGTLACEIENCRLLHKDSTALQWQYDELAKFRR